MRDRRESRSKSTQGNAARALGALNPERLMVRSFTPAELDLDSLAQAIRLLLCCENPPQLDPPTQLPAHLLPVPPRVTHVVEAKRAEDSLFGIIGSYSARQNSYFIGGPFA